MEPYVLMNLIQFNMKGFWPSKCSGPSCLVEEDWLLNGVCMCVCTPMNRTNGLLTCIMPPDIFTSLFWF